MKKTILVAAFLSCFAITAFSQTEDKALAKADKIQGVYVYVKCTPVAEYEHLGTVKGSAIGNHEMDVMTEKFIKKAKEQYPDADGIIFDGAIKQTHNTKVSAIKFKKP
ncbi:MAG: hypothetical protein WC967_14735 [Balneolaceae bacterium]